jgi:hypothetical protein
VLKYSIDRVLECVSVYVNFGPVDDIYMVVARSGDRGQMMYPLSMWLEDGVTWDGKPANGSESMYHCWGWKEAECPNSYMVRVICLLHG